MIRLLIVDDEHIERTALQRIIEEGSPDVKVVGQASNGREAIEAAERLQPDLITMDIKMPGINGLQAIEKIRETNKTVKFIVVTAFDTFEFAQQAIKLGVYDYMLKPSRISVVLETIGRVASEIKNIQLELASRRSEQELLLKMIPLVEADLVEQLLFDCVQSASLSELIDLVGMPTGREGFVMTMQFTQVSEESSTRIRDLDMAYMQLNERLPEISNPMWLGKMSGNQVPAIVFMDGEFSYRAQAISIAKKWLQVMDDRCGFRLFIGIGGLSKDIWDMRKSYQEALLASMDRTLPARYCLYENLTQDQIQTMGILTFEMEKTVLEEMRRGNLEGSGDQIVRMIDVFEGIGQGVGMSQQRIFEVLIVVSRMLQEMGMEVNTPYFPYATTSYMQLRAESRLLIHNLISLGEVVETDLLQTMKQYIQKHAHEDLSLERIAATVDRNPFYVSKLFKEHFGMNYIDFLTDYRIEMAKQLMQETDKSLKEITFEVGYNDPNYFSRVFKKLVGYAPTDYRKMLIRPTNKKHS
ncbi:response regulator [Paenibacillus qinlingensis]|uniref:Two-component system response regulator YesN n=1 Tax=Paenibacillus qinlingensis TaxID=1837343 RepID=A0ABU1NRD8_9BACL|nr:response regulator [Paenibacillus qinlingensis]MDR6549591.1 two-component system response regulator YesN [Paenibacillus qinlingensis]